LGRGALLKISDRSGPLNKHDMCADQQVQFIGRIQSHGVLFALSEPDLIVRQVSANVSAYLGISPQLVLGGSFEAILRSQQFESFQYQALSGEPMGSALLSLAVGSNTIAMHCVFHRHDGVLIVEMEPVDGVHSLSPFNIDSHVCGPLSRMEAASNIVELSRIAAGEIRKLNGFNRVMVYRFDEDWNGEVIADDVVASPISYLGLRFPASDIPPQVRQLFLINTLRMIADVDATPVDIVSADEPLTGRSLDLSHSVTRWPAPVHLEYLRNMGVQASLTISIIVERRLWGLITCHHPEPRRLDRSTRSVCELIGEAFASQVNLRIDNEALQARLTSRKLLEKCMAEIEATESLFVAGHFQGASLLDLLDADGIIANIDGFLSYEGVTPEEDLLLPVISILRNLSFRGISSSDKLSDLYSAALSYSAEASGALYVGLTDGSSDYLLLLRRELVKTVIWAGDPNASVSADEQGQLHPRSSFAAWQQTVRGRSRPWRELEIESAGVLRELLLRLQGAEKLRESQKQIQHLAHHDSLTGLINRHSIRLKLNERVSTAAASDSSFAVLFIDLDHFKHFNDSLGHAAGDTILKIVSERMQHQVRGKDVVGRLGGDEFIIILSEVQGESDLSATIARILGAISAPMRIEDKSTINITASIGISRYPVDGVSSDALLNRSDAVMYQVKRSGGNAFDLSVSPPVLGNGNIT
jgi:two-component system, chemotaxis family, sensor kinase Cph1